MWQEQQSTGSVIKAIFWKISLKKNVFFDGKCVGYGSNETDEAEKWIKVPSKATSCKFLQI